MTTVDIRHKKSITKSVMDDLEKRTRRTLRIKSWRDGRLDRWQSFLNKGFLVAAIISLGLLYTGNVIGVAAGLTLFVIAAGVYFLIDREVTKNLNAAENQLLERNMID